MVDITVFKMKIDDSTFNAPFGGRARSDGAPSQKESADSGPSMKLIAGIGAALALSLLVFVLLLKRRFGGSDADDEDEREEVYEYEEETETRDRGGIRAMIGLSFLVATTMLMKRWNTTERNTHEK